MGEFLDQLHSMYAKWTSHDAGGIAITLFEGTQADAMVLFMWQDDIIDVVRLLMQAQKGFSTHLISPEMAGKDVMNLSLSLSLTLSQLGDDSRSVLHGYLLQSSARAYNSMPACTTYMLIELFRRQRSILASHHLECILIGD